MSASLPHISVSHILQIVTYSDSWESQIGLDGQLSLHITVWLGLGLELSFQNINLFLGQAWARQMLGKFLVILNGTKEDFVKLARMVGNRVGVNGWTELGVRNRDSKVDNLLWWQGSVAVKRVGVMCVIHGELYKCERSIGSIFRCTQTAAAIS